MAPDEELEVLDIFITGSELQVETIFSRRTDHSSKEEGRALLVRISFT